MLDQAQQSSQHYTLIAAVISSVGSFVIAGLINWWKGRGQLQKDVAAIKSQVYSNGGSSLRDVVNQIAERQHVDAEIRRAGFHHSTSPIWEADHEGHITWSNAAFAKLLGVATEDLKGHGWMGMVCRDDLPKVRHEILQTGSHDHHIDYRAHRPKPQPMVLIRTRWKRVTTKDGKTVAFVGTVLSSEEVKHS